MVHPPRGAESSLAAEYNAGISTMNRLHSSRSALFAVLASVLICACSDAGGGAPPADLDSDAEASGETEVGYVFEMGDPPALGLINWSDSTDNQWTRPDFCIGGLVKFTETFSDATISLDWSQYDPSGLVGVMPALVDDGFGGRCASGAPGDLPGGAAASLLVRDVGQDSGSVSFSMISQLTATPELNYLMLFSLRDLSRPDLVIEHDSTIPDGITTDVQPPFIRVWTEAADGTKSDLLSVPFAVGEGWIRLELHRVSLTSWRLDVDGVTAGTFDVTFADTTAAARWAAIGGGGRYDDFMFGSCDVPPEGVKCESTADCPTGMVCGRDKVCRAPRGHLCSTAIECENNDQTNCRGVKDEEDFLGDGVCSADCAKHADCRPFEYCIPETPEAGSCRTVCVADADCPTGEVCLDSFGFSACTPKNCVSGGEPYVAPDGLWKCRCLPGNVFDPQTGSCPAAVACGGDAECTLGSQCRSGICLPVRDGYCFADEDCAEGATCWGYRLQPDFDPPKGGVCVFPCWSNLGCEQYEECRMGTELPWSCVPTCNDDSGCPQDLACIKADGTAPAGASGWCLPPTCLDYGQWAFDPILNFFTCPCEPGAARDTATGRCLPL